MRGKDTLLDLASNPKVTRVLLTLAFVALFALVADPVAAENTCLEEQGWNPVLCPD